MTKEEILKIAVDHYHKTIWEYPDVLNYLVLTRELTEESIKRFEIGYCDNSFFDYVHKNGLVEPAKLAGLLLDYKEWFSGFITFPVYLHKDIKNIYGRAYEKFELNHMLLKGSKKEFLYNIEALEKDCLYITESPLDAITLLQNGFNAIASFGCKISSKISQLFKNKICYLLYDSDSAGVSGALNTAYNLYPYTKKIFIVKFPDSFSKTDVNSFFYKNSKAKDRLIFLTKNAEEYKLRHRVSQEYEDTSNIPITEVGKLLFPKHKDKGDAIWVACPHHNEGKETKKSLWIGGNKNIFTCFGCGITGGPVRLVSWHLGVSKKEAISWLSNHGFV